MVYYAEPITVEAAHNLKQEEDKESIKAEWKTLTELEHLNQEG